MLRRKPATTLDSTLIEAISNTFLVSQNHIPERLANLRFLQIGCGNNPLPEFINIDFVPENEDILPWNLLAAWPSEIDGKLHGIFSEDVYEHFSYDEQMYLLCNANLALTHGGVKRILMPDLTNILNVYAKLKALRQNESTQGDDNVYGAYWRKHFLVDDPSDLLNVLLRHSGHRWLHDTDSLTKQAIKCGFDLASSSCSVSIKPELSGRNIRDENNSLSAAYDLSKRRGIRKLIATPKRLRSLSMLEKTETGGFYRVRDNDPQIIYEFPDQLAKNIVLINAHVNVIGHQAEHNLIQFFFGPGEELSFFNDRSMSSLPYNNFAQGGIIADRIGSASSICSIRVDPGNIPNAICYVGQLEIFYFSE